MSNINFGVSEVSLKTFTVKEVYDALAANGFEHLRGKWMDIDGEGKAVGGCVLGQTAFNLGVFADAEQLNDELYDIYLPKENVLEENGLSIDDQVDSDIDAFSVNTLEKQLNRFDVLNTKWSEGGNKAGGAIIYWNDKLDRNAKIPVYALPTYQDVAAMAYDILSPHFDEKVEIAVREYDLSARKVTA